MPAEPTARHESATRHPDTGPGLSVIVAGCDGSWTGPGGAGSGYLVASGTTRLLLDVGPGSFANLQCYVDAATIDAVVISHHHPDHWTDLHPFSTHARLALDRGRIPVYAPAGVAERAGLGESPVLEWHEVTGGDSRRIGDLDCSFRRTDHSFETLAVRIDGGQRAFGYSADTGPGWSLTELGTDLDLMLSEATYTVEYEGTAGHISGRQAGERARGAGARRLVVTHRWPTIDPASLVAEVERSFEGSVEQAVIGKEFVL